jgi:hypothetical protein
MNDRQNLLTMLREEGKPWEELLASMSEDQRTAPHLPSNWSTEDIIAHLMSWQQVSFARLEACCIQPRAPFSLVACWTEPRVGRPARYPWLKGYALSVVLQGSCEHHHEHLLNHCLPESGTTRT